MKKEFPKENSDSSDGQSAANVQGKFKTAGRPGGAVPDLAGACAREPAARRGWAM